MQITVSLTIALGPRGYYQKNWAEVCSPLLKTLTLFRTKICDFPTSFPEPFPWERGWRFSLPYLRPNQIFDNLFKTRSPFLEGPAGFVGAKRFRGFRETGPWPGLFEGWITLSTGYKITIQWIVWFGLF